MGIFSKRQYPKHIHIMCLCVVGLCVVGVAIWGWQGSMHYILISFCPHKRKNASINSTKTNIYALHFLCSTSRALLSELLLHLSLLRMAKGLCTISSPHSCPHKKKLCFNNFNQDQPLCPGPFFLKCHCILYCWYGNNCNSNFVFECCSAFLGCVGLVLFSFRGSMVCKLLEGKGQW